jgi:hypothetical protein
MTVRANYSIGERPTVDEMNTFAANPALQYITQVNINAVTTTVSNVFSSTYDNYRLEWSNVYTTAGFTTFPLVSFTGGAGTAHFDGIKTTNSAGANTFNNQNGTAYWLTAYVGLNANESSHITMDINAPFLTVDTTYTSKFSFQFGGGFAGGVVRSATSYTGFTIVGLFGSNIVGTLRIYGYRKS